MLSSSASSSAAWMRCGSAATASGSGWGGGSMRFCVERTPREHGEDEVVIVERVLRDRHGQQQVQRFGMRDVVPEPEEGVICGVVETPIHGGEKRLLRAFDAARVHGLGISQDVRAHAGMIDVLVR